MRYMRCKCGKHTCWTSMGHPRCSGCEECNTTLEEYPDMHTEPEPHDWRVEWRIDPDNGVRWQERVCLRCMKREKVEEPARVAGGS